MDKEAAEAFLHAQMKPVYGYCLRRCATPQDAEDLAQEVLLRAYAVLLRRSIPDPLRYLWTVARNTLATTTASGAAARWACPPTHWMRQTSPRRSLHTIVLSD